MRSPLTHRPLRATAACMLSLLWFPAAHAAGPAFGEPVAIAPAVVSAQAMQLADVDGDGRDDLLVLAGSGAQVEAYRRKLLVYAALPAGGFAPTPAVHEYTSATGMQWEVVLQVADLDLDGDIDVVVTEGGGSASVLLNQGGTFVRGAGTALANTYRGVELFDIDGDGLPDMLAHDGSGRLWVHAGDGKGGFGSYWEVPLGYWPAAPIFADIDGDGRRDLVVTSDGRVRMRRHLGNGFGAERTLATVNGTLALPKFGDFDGDGRIDMLLLHTSARNRVLSVYEQQANGSFRRGTAPQAVPFDIDGLLVEDVDGDGHADVVSGVDSLTGRLGFHRWRDGRLQPREAMPGYAPAAVAFTDVDRDGRLDLLAMFGGITAYRGGTPISSGDLAVTLRQAGATIVARVENVGTATSTYSNLFVDAESRLGELALGTPAGCWRDPANPRPVQCYSLPQLPPGDSLEFTLPFSIDGAAGRNLLMASARLEIRGTDLRQDNDRAGLQARLP